MRGYRDVDLFQFDDPLSVMSAAQPVAVEVRDSSERLPNYEHPPNAVYVFGPEDGSLPGAVLARCHRFVRHTPNHPTHRKARETIHNAAVNFQALALHQRIKLRLSQHCDSIFHIQL
jgi:tRNA(Leu) C34 or U34 (ribose-2'-O)-methylase TrmL